MRARGVRNVKVLALQIRGDQGDKWHSYEVDLPAGGRFKVKHSYACEVHLLTDEPGMPEKGQREENAALAFLLGSRRSTSALFELQ